jgi:Flp pilus assembly protein TadB
LGLKLSLYGLHLCRHSAPEFHHPTLNQSDHKADRQEAFVTVVLVVVVVVLVVLVVLVLVVLVVLLVVVVLVLGEVPPISPQKHSTNSQSPL